MKTETIGILLLPVLLWLPAVTTAQPLTIIPEPQLVSPQRGNCIIKGKLTIHYQNADSILILPAIRYFTSALPSKIRYSIKPDIKVNIQALASPVPVMIFEKTKKDFFRNEQYNLLVQPKVIRIEAGSQAGFFYAVQTLLQLIPVEFLNPEMPEWSILELPCLEMEDYPYLEYRGLHLDVVRHFFSVSEVKKYIDVMAQYKLNRFHWHLTDDQGWRIEIKKYPKLIEIGSNRSESMTGAYDDQQFDNTPYGGYYTQEDIREVVSYAAERSVEVIPEIEMPGHAMAALAAYPELSCNGGPFEVATSWGVFDDVFCTTEPVFRFLESVLEEVCELFPGRYIHIGGDECPKTRWKTCSLCQTRIKTEGLKDENELQSWFVQRIEKFLEQKGKQVIGWDEILEGGLDGKATIMSWRGTEGGIAAARQHHDVIMTPGSHCYFDHYQASPELSPLAFGGYTPVDKVYHFSPVPDDSLTPEQKVYIIGAQGNLWTEYIIDFSHVQYMAYPRALALAEVLWSNPEHRNWDSFSSRLIQHFRRLQLQGVNYSNDLFNVTSAIFADSVSHQLFISLSKQIKDGRIYFTTNGSDPDSTSFVYSEPVPVKTSQLKAKLISGLGPTKTLSRNFRLHKATGLPYELTFPLKQYDAGTAFGLTDGITGKVSQYNTWVGFSGNDLEATLDLRENTEVRKVSVNFYNKNRAWIFLPQYLEISVSDDGMDFYPVARQEIISNEEPNSIINSTFILPDQKMRFLRIRAKNIGICPPGSVCEGQKAWLFADEIVVE
ncbi:MAG: family 20 glycosylhydrolase [Bacteroidia bacterium]|nr:family 20 glycosylhydrolase [Bacteroidia bacterium]MCZ2278143.1 family 20 glycosylhydrolase [Bacteroidia bacterium]